MTIPYDADTFFDLGDEQIRTALVNKSADEIEAFMIVLQNHVDEERRKRGIVAEIYASKRDLEVQVKKLEELSDEHLLAELARRQANAQTITVEPVIGIQSVMDDTP